MPLLGLEEAEALALALARSAHSWLLREVADAAVPAVRESLDLGAWQLTLAAHSGEGTVPAVGRRPV